MTPEVVESRYEAAKAEAKAAAKAWRVVVTDSKALLKKLMAMSPEEQLAQLESVGDKLLRPDRRFLMESLRTAQPAPRPIIATTASRYEVWRSRLPYRVFPLSGIGALLVVAIVLATSAYRHTPIRWATVKANQDTQVRLQGPDGTLSDGTVSPGGRFALMRIDTGADPQGDIGVFRYWVDGEGYGEFRLSMKDVE